MEKRDAPGLVRLGVQLAWFSASATATLQLATAGSAWAWAAVASCGVALATFFPPLHEAGHQTAFRTAWLNEATAWLCAVLMLQAPSFFREFHWEHHRTTQDPTRDPEIAAAPQLLDGWPKNPLVYLALASGQMLLVGKLMFTLGGALMPTAKAWAHVFPFVRERKRRRIAWESRLVLALLAGGLAAGLALVPGFAMLLLAWPIAHLVLGIYLMPEHTGLAHDGSQTHRTRTVHSNAVVRWFMWNMPYHAEHHEHPAVPFHAVPQLHRQMAPALENTSRGYLSFHAEALRRAFGRAA